MLLSGVLLPLPFSKSLSPALGLKSISCNFPACSLSEAWAAPLPCKPRHSQAQGVCCRRRIIRSGISLHQAYHSIS